MVSCLSILIDKYLTLVKWLAASVRIGLVDTNFRNYLILRGQTRHTITCTINAVEKLLNHCDPLTTTAVRSYMAVLLSDGLSPTYINKILTGFRNYLHFLEEEHKEFDQELLKIKHLKEKEFARATMSDQEIEDFLAIPPPTITFKHFRSGTVVTRTIDPKRHDFYTIFFSVCAFTGARPGEIAKLKIEDIDWGRNVFILRETKTNENRLVPIAPRLVEPLKKYLTTLKEDWVFPSPRGGTKDGVSIVDNVDWHYNFHARIKRLGIKRPNLSPYSLRHSLITRLLEEDINLFKVQQLVGHRRLETTAHYTHLTTKTLQKTIQQDPMNVSFNDPRVVVEQVKKALEPFHLMENEKLESILQESVNGLSFSLKIKQNI